MVARAAGCRSGCASGAGGAGANLQAVDGHLAVPARPHRAHGGLEREQQPEDELLLLCARASFLRGR